MVVLGVVDRCGQQICRIYSAHGECIASRNRCHFATFDTLIDHQDARIFRSGDFCADRQTADRTDHFIPCTCGQGNKPLSHIRLLWTYSISQYVYSCRHTSSECPHSSKVFPIWYRSSPTGFKMKNAKMVVSLLISSYCHCRFV